MTLSIRVKSEKGDKSSEMEIELPSKTPWMICSLTLLGLAISLPDWWGIIPAITSSLVMEWFHKQRLDICASWAQTAIPLTLKRVLQ